MYTKSYRKELISGWGNYQVEYGMVFRPEKIKDLAECVGNNRESIIARGWGRSYGDASINTDGINIDMTRLNKMLRFDNDKGILNCQSGVTMGDIVEYFLPRGWLPSITPGTQYSTVGGCIACNVHGKNWKDGAFSNYIHELRLMLHDGTIVRCNENNSHQDLFRATIGGMGMTGIILDAKLQLRKVTSSYFQVENITFVNIDELFSIMEESVKSHDYIFSWIDSQQTGKSMGRGVLQRAMPCSENDLIYKKYSSVTVPIFFPKVIVNKYSVQAFNTLYYHKCRQGEKNKTLYVTDFFYPLDRILHWNKVYGKNGFLEYQFAIPADSAFDTIRKVMKIISEHKIGSVVAAVKPIIESKGDISFPINGYTFAVDILNSYQTLSILEILDHVVCENGGRVYLAKDARLSSNYFKQMYDSSIDKWDETRHKYGLKGKFSSRMFKRILHH